MGISIGSTQSEVAVATVSLPFLVPNADYRVFPILIIGDVMATFMKEYDVELLVAEKKPDSFKVVIHRGSYGLLGAHSAWNVDVMVRGSLM